MSQRTSTRPGDAVICRYESLALWANAAAAPKHSATATTPRSAARQPAACSEDRIDPPVVQPERRLQAPRFLDRVAAAGCARSFGEDEQVERLALARDVAARERKRALGVAVDRQREHRLLAAVEDRCLGTLVGERDPFAHFGDVALAA